MYAPGTRPYRGAWRETIAAAEQYNEPGRFTAFIGYEWTSNTGGNPAPQRHLPRQRRQGEPGRAVHRVSASRERQPGGTLEVDGGLREQDRRQRARHRAQRQSEQRPDVPGRRDLRQEDRPRDYAEQRTRWERLYEATQTKGDGEAHPFLSPNDEFANFERWDFGNLDANVAKTREMLEFEYARSALKNGLKLGQALGVNPYKFGLVGSSDAHTGLAAMEEDNFFGKTTPQEPSPERMLATFFDNPKTGIKVMDWRSPPRGMPPYGRGEHPSLAVGCHAAPGDLCDDRPAHARAVLRRMGLRRAGREQPFPAQTGYTKGVPMGGELRAPPQGKSPTFLVAALKDPLGANLDRYQIVKGWLTKTASSKKGL